MSIFHCATESIGNTPLLKIGNVYAKLETINPSGSIKDRMAAYILEQAEKEGKIKKGQTIIEATSGNTGIAFSMLAASKGYKMIAVMPKNMSQERVKMIQAFGANVEFVADNDFLGAVAHRDKRARELNAFIPDQFANPLNVDAHFNGTGKEILEQLTSPISAFVAGVGTGGTLFGTVKRIRTRDTQCKCVAVEPLESAAMSGKKPGTHRIQGIGDGFIPEIVKLDAIDEIVTIPEQEAVNKTLALWKQGILVGISSAANLLAAEYRYKEYGGNVVTVLPDRGERYLSML